MQAQVLQLGKLFHNPGTAFDRGGADFAQKSNALVLDQPDGGVVVQFNPRASNSAAASSAHSANLADFLDEGDLSWLAEHLLEGIDEDDRSRAEWLRTRTNGLKLLGLKIEEPRSDLGSSSAPMEGMSTVRHPLLAEACLRFQANARGEFLPSDGPAKVKNAGPQTAEMDAQAQALEDAFNEYLVSGAPEYVPDMDRMLFQVGYSGMAFKKIYPCPIRRRPVSDAVDAEHLIVANTATDLQTAPRVTHEIPMGQSTLRRMQLAGVYRDIDLDAPVQDINKMDAAVARQMGLDLNATRPDDQTHTIYECYCEVDLPGFEHKKKGKETGLPLPYRVAIDKTSRTILEIRRDWKEDDEDCLRKRTFVPFPFVQTFGLYGTGLLQILGNATAALTAAWRELLDAGMFSNFPGFLYAKNGSRQVANNFRVPPGGGAPVDVSTGMKLSDAIMPLPYKGPDVATMQLVENVASTGQRLGGTAEVQVGEGNQEAPVGTTLAMIEQAAKVLDAVHKRIHTAVALELKLLRDLFVEDPEALWRGTPNRSGWNAETVIAALNNTDLQPRSDPNTPSSTHRMMKGVALVQLNQAFPGVFDQKALAVRLLGMLKIEDGQSLLAPPQPPSAAQPSPEMIKAQTAHETNQVKMANLQSKENIEHMKIAERLAVHPYSQEILSGMNP